MKMIIVIVKDSDADSVNQELISKEFRVTRIASTGGFLRSGVVTLLIGVDDDRVQDGINVIRDHWGQSNAQESSATLFGIPVKRFEKI